MCKDLLLLAGVSVQIHAISATFSVTDHKHVLLVCRDIFSSIFPILNNISKFKMETSNLSTSRITLTVPIHHQITKEH